MHETPVSVVSALSDETMPSEASELSDEIMPSGEWDESLDSAPSGLGPVASIFIEESPDGLSITDSSSEHAVAIAVAASAHNITLRSHIGLGWDERPTVSIRRPEACELDLKLNDCQKLRT